MIDDLVSKSASAASKLTHKGMVIFVLCCCMVAQGFLFIFLLDKQLFLSMDFYKLFFLSASVGAPFVCLYSFMGYVMISSLASTAGINPDFQEQVNTAGILGAIMTIFILALNSLFFYLIPNINYVILIDIVGTILAVISRNQYSKSKFNK